MFRNRSVNVHQFAMVPRAEIPRSAFRMQKAYKTTFDSGELVPMMVEEVLPGDTFSVNLTAFARMATPIFPFMDNLHFETFFFFVPNRLVWTNWQRFMGERDPDPDSSIDFLVPTATCPAGGYAIGSLQDYMGLPTAGQVDPAGTITHNNLPCRAYNLIYNEWFRDQNLQDSRPLDRDDGPDDPADYIVVHRGKRHDYFTSALPFVQKGDPVQLPLGTSAPVVSAGLASPAGAFRLQGGTNGTVYTYANLGSGPITNALGPNGTAGGVTQSMIWPTDSIGPNLVADLSEATASTINAIRQAFQVQKLLERDARGGTRYTEIVRSHFGVISPDARLQRPEYLGGGYSSIAVNPVAQTGPTDTESPQGNLAAFAQMTARGHGFSQSFTEHGYIIGLMNVRADLTYQQGMRKHWLRSTRYDFYFPVFAMLGEQPVLNKEIYARGDANDDLVFGYQERWAEYRYNPSEVTGLMRSTAVGTLDAWHLAQQFTSLPVLNTTFIQDNPPIPRVVAVDMEGTNEFLFDGFFDMRVVRPLPMYSVPGLVDHF